MQRVLIRSVSETYGDDYIDQFKSILNRYAFYAKTFLEWGSGHTTFEIVRFADAKGGCEIFCTLDDYGPYQHELLSGFKDPPSWFLPLVESREGPMKSQRDPELAYSTRPLLLRDTFDFIFIDGRRRMECALTAALLSHERTVTVIHDYRRGRYQPVEALFDLVEDGMQFRVMQIRPAIREAFGQRKEKIIRRLRTLNNN